MRNKGGSYGKDKASERSAEETREEIKGIDKTIANNRAEITRREEREVNLKQRRAEKQAELDLLPSEEI